MAASLPGARQLGDILSGWRGLVRFWGALLLVPAEIRGWISRHELWSEGILSVETPGSMALAIFLNNLRVAFSAALLGITAGLGTVIVLFPLGSGSAESVAAGAAAGAKLVSPTWFENVLLVTDETPGLAGRLEEQGALGVFENLHFAGISFAGCIGASLR